MSANVDPEEAEAIRDLLDESRESAVVEVVERDFRRPRRLSGATRAAIARELQAAITPIETAIGELLGNACRAEIASVSETTADGLFDGEGPFAAARIDIGGQPGWVVWDVLAAVAVVETILGSTSERPMVRRFTPMEIGPLESVLASFADGVLRALEIEANGLRFGQSADALGEWRDGGADADPYRVHVELAFEGAGEQSMVHVYLPAFATSVETNGAEPKLEHLPSHLDAVEIDVTVRIEGCEVSLEQLLALEEGDVIPLDARVGDPSMICVDGRVVGYGITGSKGGNLAVRIERLNNGTIQ